MKKQIIFVLGMHRSGTSAVTRGLKVLGVELGENLMPPVPNNNETGFWEDLDINSLNEEILALIGCKWDSSRYIEPDEFAASQFSSLRVRAVELLHQKIGRSDRFGIKNPRMCKTLPFWQQVIRHCDFDDRYVITTRNPLSVARSLAARDSFSAEKSYLLWLGHMIPALAWTEGKLRVVVDYDLFMDEPIRQMERVAGALGLTINGTITEELKNFSQAFISQGLRHTQFSIGHLNLDSRLPGLAADAYGNLLKLAQGDMSPDDPECVRTWNRISEIYLSMTPLYSLLDKELAEHEQQIDNLNQIISSRDDQIVTLDKAVGDRDIQIGALGKTIAERDEIMIDTKQVLGKREKEVAGLNQLVSNHEAHILSLNQEIINRDEQITGLSATINEIRLSTSWRITLPLRIVGTVVKSSMSVLLWTISGILRFLYHRMPLSNAMKYQMKTYFYERFGFLIRNTKSYKHWAAIKKDSPNDGIVTHIIDTTEPIDITESIEFMERDHPEISVVIPVRNYSKDLYRLLRSIRRDEGKHHYEVIIVDDCSSDDTPSVLSGVVGLQYIRNEQKAGFERSCNIGATFTRGKYIVFLRDVAIVLPHWLDELVETFKEHPDTGLVGSKLLSSSGLLFEAGSIIGRDASISCYGQNDDPNKPEYNYLREIGCFSSGAIMTTRELFREMDGFDEVYAYNHYGSADLALSISRAGHKIFYQPLSCVVYHEHQSPEKDESDVRMKLDFSEKWKDDLTRLPEPETGIHCESAHPKILIVDIFTPTPDQDSGSVDAFLYMKIFRSLSFDVTFIPAANLLFMAKYTHDLQRIGVRCLYAPYVTDIGDHLKQYGHSYDVVMLYRAHCAASLIDDVQRYCTEAKIIFNTVDLHYLREQRQAVVEGSKRLAKQAEDTKAMELSVIQKADCTIILSPAEYEILSKEPDASGKNIAIIPLVREIPGLKTPFKDRKDIVFVGSYLHRPNVDAVLYFAADVWPLIRLKLPDVKFHIVGSNTPAEIMNMSGDGIVIAGYVKDLSTYFDFCRLSVAPLRYGAGLKGKVGASMSYGLPCVASPIAVEGAGFREEEDVLVADTPESFANAVARLYTDEILWNRLSANGLNFVEAHYSVHSVRERLVTLLDNLGIKQSR